MTLPGAVTAQDDEARRTRRRENRVTAILHSGHPVRYWDHDLGPDEPRLLAAPAAEEPSLWRDLTPQPAGGLVESSYDITPDGATVVTTWRVLEAGGATRGTLVAIDVASGERSRVLADDPGHDFDGPLVAPDGARVLCRRESRSTATTPTDIRLVVLPLDGGAPVEVAPGWDRRPGEVEWTPDGTALVVAADEGGRRPVFRVVLSDGTVTRLTGDDGAYTDPRVSPDGRHVPPAATRRRLRRAGPARAERQFP